MKRMIIVEDDPGLAEMIVLAFASTDLEITCFGNGKLIMDGTYQRPNLFLLDKQLPGIDGLDICRHLKSSEETRMIPVIIMSANLSIAELAGQAGADDLIMKPFNIGNLKKMVLHYLG